MRIFFLFFLALILTFPQGNFGRALAAAPATQMAVTADAEGVTRFSLPLPQTTPYRLFFLNNPPRAVVDVPAQDDGQTLQRLTPTGVVSNWRRGQFGDGTRFVLDLAGPVSLVSVARAGESLLLTLSLAHGAEFQALIGQKWGDLSPVPVSVPPQTQQSAPSGPLHAIRPPLLPDWKKAGPPLPLVVIDAGHGGVDPGALSVTGAYEKNLTMAIARQVALRLESSGRYRVEMTRTRDVFVPLRERVVIARRLKADVFISLHADSISSAKISGATLYTLSEKASDAEAQELADSENRADQLAGLEQAGADNQVAEVLISMSHRATMNGSKALASALLSPFKNTVPMTEKPHRSAGFAVLKAPDIPSILIEMGYLSNPKEFARLSEPGYQHKIAVAIEAGLNAYFKGRVPGSTHESRTLRAALQDQDADLIAAGLKNN